MTENFCGNTVTSGGLGDCLGKMIACDFEVSIRLRPTLFTSAPERNLRLDYVRVSNFPSEFSTDLFHTNKRSSTFYDKLKGTLNGDVCCT